MLMPKLENPWEIKSIYELQYFNCPSCSYKIDSKQDFVCHAFDSHPDSVIYLRNIVDESLSDILCPWDSTEYKGENFDELTTYLNQDSIQNHHDASEEFQDICNLTNNDDSNSVMVVLEEDLSESAKIDCNSSENTEVKSEDNNITTLDPLQLTTEKVINKKKDLNNPISTVNKSEHTIQGNHDGLEDQNNIKCQYCEMPLTSAIRLRRHIKKSHEEKVKYKCNICDKTFFSVKGSVQRHKCVMNIDSKTNGDHNYVSKPSEIIESSELNPEETRNTLEIQRNVLKNFLEIQQNVSNIHEEHKPKSSGRKQILSQKVIRNNDEMHESKEQNSCKICGKSFPKAQNLKAHINYVHDGNKPPRIFKCETCGKLFSDKSKVMKHAKTVHEGIKEYKCESCGKSYAYKESLRDHIKTVHQDKREFECKSCGKKYKIIKQLHSHIRIVHEKKLPYKCEFCNNFFSAPSILKNHVEIVHEKRKDYQCETCGEKFGTAYRLKIHHYAKHHKGVKERYPCSSCDKTFASKASVREHVKLVHKCIKNFSCDICGKTFGQSCKLKIHQATVHEGRRDHKCSLCDKKFAEKGTLTKHVNTVHKSDIISKVSVETLV